MVYAALERNPGRSLTNPEDVANAIAVLSLEDYQWIDGNVIAIDNCKSIVNYIKIIYK